MAYYVVVCGFWVPRQTFQPYFLWLHYLSPIKYAFEAIAQVFFNR